MTVEVSAAIVGRAGVVRWRLTSANHLLQFILLVHSSPAGFIKTTCLGGQQIHG